MRKEPPGEKSWPLQHLIATGEACSAADFLDRVQPTSEVFVCPKGGKSCGFFVWVDIEMPRRERALMAWLLRTKREVEDQIVRREQERRSCGLLCLFLGPLCLWFGLAMLGNLVKAETNLVVQTGRLVQTKQLQTLVQTEKLEMAVQTEMLDMVELVEEMVVELG
ncbi:uncharacterized protein Pyn_26107 [Prunus yedoensis var. nudiflora]|uniref:Zinc finger GRF-type domain-containing protein n=1 Tax=Prunus yedoensis var. nudiflora TaxID=2094558 RepID=A0A314XZB7_PRUYE|nr:uncharacterized protein Pyn_26107 [Prunus yedoensis var. nudiflora]